MSEKIVLITGGSGGIGLSTAHKFFDNGFHVLVCGSNAARLQAVKSEFGHSERFRTFVTDVSSLADITALYQKIADDGIKLDTLVLNAGVAAKKRFEDVTEKDYDKVMDINVKGAFFCLQKALPLFKDEASVVFVTSISNQLGSPEFITYGSSKAAVRSMVKSTALGLIGRGIRVNAVSPGPIDTPIHEKFDLSVKEQQNRSQMMANRSPIKRFGAPMEIANVIYFLSSQDASYIVGEEMVVDAGMSLL